MFVITTDRVQKETLVVKVQKDLMDQKEKRGLVDLSESMENRDQRDSQDHKDHQDRLVHLVIPPRVSFTKAKRKLSTLRRLKRYVAKTLIAN